MKQSCHEQNAKQQNATTIQPYPCVKFRKMLNVSETGMVVTFMIYLLFVYYAIKPKVGREEIHKMALHCNDVMQISTFLK